MALPDALEDAALTGSDLLESQAGQIRTDTATKAFDERVAAGELDAALRLVKALVQARRRDVIKRSALLHMP